MPVLKCIFPMTRGIGQAQKCVFHVPVLFFRNAFQGNNFDV